MNFQTPYFKEAFGTTKMLEKIGSIILLNTMTSVLSLKPLQSILDYPHCSYITGSLTLKTLFAVKDVNVPSYGHGCHDFWYSVS